MLEQAPFGTASQSSAARVRGLVEMLRTCEVHSSKPSSNETLCGISKLLLREICSVLNDEDLHRLRILFLCSIFCYPDGSNDALTLKNFHFWSLFEGTSLCAEMIRVEIRLKKRRRARCVFMILQAPRRFRFAEVVRQAFLQCHEG